MKAGKVLAFIFGVFVLMGIGWVLWPAEGIDVLGYTVRFPSMTRSFDLDDTRLIILQFGGNYMPVATSARMIEGFSLFQNKVLLRNAYLFAASLFFYYKTSGLFVLLLLFVVVYNYFAARRLSPPALPADSDARRPLPAPVRG